MEQDFVEAKEVYTNEVAFTIMNRALKDVQTQQAAIISGDVWIDKENQNVVVDITTGTNPNRQQAGEMLGKVTGLPVVYC